MVPENHSDDQSRDTQNSADDEFLPDYELSHDESIPPEWEELAGEDAESIELGSTGQALTVREKLIALFNARTNGSPAPINQVHNHVTEKYLAALDPGEGYDPEVIESELLGLTISVIKNENKRTKNTTEKLPLPKRLSPTQISAVLRRFFRIAEITPGGLETDDDSVGILGMYQTCGEHEGTYRRADTGLLQVEATRLNSAMSQKEYQEVEWNIRLHVPKVEENLDEDVILTNDGIFDYRTNGRRAFTPDIVRTAKIPQRLWLEKPPVPRVLDKDGNEVWEFERWMTETFPDEGTRNAMWQILGMCVRPLVDWQKMPCLYSEKGSNGKGTFLDMIEAIVGSRNTSHISLEDYDSQFGASSIIGKRLNLVHEVAVNQFMKKSDRLKAIITNDPIEINRKHKDAISYKPQLVNVVALNGALQFGDKTESMERRLMILPMEMHFKDGQKNEAIKKDYVKRREVSEYILYKVLVELPKYWTLTIPESAKRAMGEHRLETNKVAAFVHEFQHEFERSFLPLTMLRDLFTAWLKKNHPASKAVSSAVFNKEIQGLFDPEVWMIPTNDKGEPRKFGVKSWLSGDEPPLDEFSGDREVEKWRFAHRYDNAVGHASWALGENLPRQARGFMRREDFDAWEAAGSPTSESGIRAVLDRKIVAAANAETAARGGMTVGEVQAEIDRVGQLMQPVDQPFNGTKNDN